MAEPDDPQAASFSDASAHETAFQDGLETRPAAKDVHKGGPMGFFRELPILILIAFGLALLIKTFLVQAFYIPSESMVPTLLVGDRVLVNKLVYRFRDPHRGEIVVFVAEPDNTKRNAIQRFFKSLGEGMGARQPPERDFIKRVIGLPGDTIQIKDGLVTITPAKGRAFTLNEPYLNEPRDASSFGPYKVPANSYFLMGDNRANSSDSRVNTFGGLCDAPPCSIPKNRIVGRAFTTIWPPSRLSFHHAPKYESLRGIGGWWADAPVFA